MLPCWPNTEILRDAFVVIFLPGGLPDILCRQLYSISLTLWMVATCYRISIFHVLPARPFEYITELLHIYPFQSWKRTHLSSSRIHECVLCVWVVADKYSKTLLYHQTWNIYQCQRLISILCTRWGYWYCFVIVMIRNDSPSKWLLL